MQGKTAVRRYEANAVDTADVCFTYPITTARNANFIVSYDITSDEMLVHMNLRSNASNSILRSRRLPTTFKELYENAENLTEAYEIEFCALSDMTRDNADVSTPASAVIYDVKYLVTSSGTYLLMSCIGWLINYEEMWTSGS